MEINNNNITKSKEIYEVWKENDNYYITVEVSNKQMNIVKATYFYDEEGVLECYTKIKYTKKIFNSDNLFEEMNEFVDNKIDTIKEKISKTIEFLNNKYDRKIPANI